jgi:hypothetical protein
MTSRVKVYPPIRIRIHYWFQISQFSEGKLRASGFGIVKRMQEFLLKVYVSAQNYKFIHFAINPLTPSGHSAGIFGLL